MLLGVVGGHRAVVEGHGVGSLVYLGRRYHLVAEQRHRFQCGVQSEGAFADGVHLSWNNDVGEVCIALVEGEVANLGD